MTTPSGNKKVSKTWFAPGLEKSVICPVDGCDHAGQYISKAHCRIVHGMERDEVAKKYGYPEITNTKGFIASDSNMRKWNSVTVDNLSI